jgi:drug/metabolite transporter (DMT)-like permease
VTTASFRAWWSGLHGNSQGGLLLLANAALMSLLVLSVRQIGDTVPVMVIVVARNLFSGLILLPFVLRAGTIATLRTRRLDLHLWRGALTVGSMVAYYWSYSHLPLAVATSLMFTMPLFLIVVAAIALGERVRWRRTTATVIGFLGVLFIVRPGGAGFDPLILVPLIVALTDAILGAIIKALTRVDRLLTIMVYMCICTLLFSLVPAAFFWHTPTLEESVFLFAIAAISTVSQMLTVTAWRVGEATAVAPVNYVQIVVIGMVGYLAFGEVPTLWSFIGAAIIAASTFYIVHREARLKAAATARSGPASP